MFKKEQRSELSVAAGMCACGFPFLFPRSKDSHALLSEYVALC